MKITVRKPTEEERQAMEGCPIWEKEPSEFPWHYGESETCLILDGEVDIETADETISFGSGDLVIFPEGLDCTWKIKQGVRKHYKFG
ncbi:MAG: cupin domain-containing protein [Planctomycetia bacterium]